jgi:hypothetical protein
MTCAHREAGESDADELLGVEGAVPVLRSCHRLGQHYARRVGRLPDAAQVHPPRYLLRDISDALSQRRSHLSDHGMTRRKAYASLVKVSAMLLNMAFDTISP